LALRAVVIGAGWAGEGHVVGLRDAGVEVVALCGRTPEPAYKRAAQLGVDAVRFDWRAAIEELRPDIVTIGVPGAPHREMAEFAAQAGCHIVCEKPLAINAADARAMLEVVERAGVKHAYAATGCYSPAIIHAQALIAQGAIGQLREVESSLRWFMPAGTMPYSWFDQLELGGGLLNNIFVHKLAQVVRATGGTVRAAAGETRVDPKPVPVGPQIHDVRELFGPIEGWNPAQATEWRQGDADAAYTVMAQVRLPDGNDANALFRASAFGTTPHPEYLVFYGDAGALYMTGEHGAEDRIQRFVPERQAWEDVLIPPAVIAALPPTEDLVQCCWNQFFREFVADVQGNGYAGYPTFHDGWAAAEVIDIARAQSGWTALSERVGEPAVERSAGG
jgi:predicted dehydrogenase